jgi:lipopolysaccharide export system protein LptA
MYQSKNKRCGITCLWAIALLLGPTICLAERADRNEPMHLEADQVVMDDAKQISTFTGKVRLSQGTLLILGDKIVVVQDKDAYKHASVFGDPAEFRQKQEGSNEYVEGYGERIDYDMRTETLDFSGNARLKRKLDEVSGDHITYNTKTEIFQVNGTNASVRNAPKQRVRVVLQPKPQQTPATPTQSGVTNTPVITPPPKKHE